MGLRGSGQSLYFILGFFSDFKILYFFNYSEQHDRYIALFSWVRMNVIYYFFGALLEECLRILGYLGTWARLNVLHLFYLLEKWHQLMNHFAPERKATFPIC